ncbi:hypothetical protein [Nocardia aurantia]|uniref:Uncharacterized protein n=1 Tax=Nocardia aurantia TaxID=2585199 RepID=A0A7K0DGR1_9NOCA|nr:hypothetical protein [Nocardia aurantia]MQY25000.1 hypothetical protein [Nocardia aurantia]
MMPTDDRADAWQAWDESVMRRLEQEEARTVEPEGNSGTRTAGAQPRYPALRSRHGLDGTPFADDRSPLPAPTDADSVWARAHPGEWRYYVDPGADDSAVQNSNILGGRLADDEGGFSEVWLNPAFTPLPKSLRRDYFETPLELVLWRFVSGFGTVRSFITAFGNGEVIMVLREDDPLGREWPLRRFSDGSRVLRVFTASKRLPADINPWLRRSISGREVQEQICTLPGVDVLFEFGNGRDMIIMRGWELAEWWDLAEAERRRETK